jgi:O-antigen/teichoic acid export membrane protein
VTPPASGAATALAPERQRPAPQRAAEPRRLAINFLFLSGGEFGAKLLTFASFTYLARSLGPWHYGLLEFTLAIIVFFSLPVDLGLGAYGAREIARKPQNAARLLGEITGLRLLLALFSMLCLGIFILVIHKSVELKLLLAVYGLSLLGGPFLLQWFFQAHDQMHWVGAASTLRQAVFALFIFFVWRQQLPFFYIGFAESLSVAAVAVFCVYVVRYRMHYPWPRPDMHPTYTVGHIWEAAPIGITEVAWAFMWYFCTVLLGFVFSDKSLGWFGASHRTLMALHTFVWLYFFNLFPSISRCVALPLKELLILMDRSLRLVSWAGLFAGGVLTAMAPVLLSLLYGPAFRAGAASFGILVWMLPVAMLSGHHRYILIAYNQQKTLLACTIYSALGAVLLGFLLVPWYGGEGAAWALLLANISNLVLVYRAVKQLVTEVSVHRQMAAPLKAFAVSAILYLGLARWNSWAGLAAATAMYVAVLARTDGQLLASFVLEILKKGSMKRSAA